jgi:selenocysteine-specific elongation factor
MKSVIVGTAGHIDHGKSALVRALTGTDPDRLEEEKRRGITIDIGFAHLEMPASELRQDAEATAGKMPALQETLRLGFVDVPGHERFVRNMLAGAGGIDVVLLVVAADEGIKPQTREHFDIVRLLNIPRGIAVLTKSDLVDAETLDVVRLEVEEYLRGSFMEGAPTVPVSSKTGAGLDDLKRALAQVAGEVRAKDSQAAPRLPIDRVFSMKGFGTVVTGTLVSGTIRKEQELVVFPGGRVLRVRGVQVHGAQAEQAVAGERTALNLAGVDVTELARGMTLSVPGSFHTTSRVDVALTLLRDAKPLRDRAKVHVHFHTTETIAEVVLLGPDAGSRSHTLNTGETAYAQLRMREPWLVLPGDRFIIRQFSPVITIGGGVVLDAAPLARKTASSERIAFLQTLEPGTRAEVLAARVARRGTAGLTIEAAVAETGWWPKKLVEDAAANLVRVGDVLVSSEAYAEAKQEIVAALAAFHKANPLVSGAGKGELMEKLGLEETVFHSLMETLVREKKLEVSGEQLRLAGRGVAMKDDEAESQRQIEQAFASAGLRVPALKDVLAGLKVDRVRAQKIVTLLLRDRVLVKLSDDLVFHRDALDWLRKTLAAQKATSPKIDVAKFKDLAGVSRKYAIPLLEWLDRERVTRRVGDERIIL